MDLWIGNPNVTHNVLFNDEDKTSRARSASMFAGKKNGYNSMFSNVGSSMPDIAQSVTEDMNLHMRASSVDNLNESQLDMENFETSSATPLKQGGDFVVSDSPLRRSASCPHGPPRPPRMSWMKKTPKKITDGENKFNVYEDAEDDLIQPYARVSSVRIWARQKGLSQSGFNSRLSQDSSNLNPQKPKPTRKPSVVYDTEYVWGQTPTSKNAQSYDHLKARTKVREMCTPRKSRPAQVGKEDKIKEDPLEGDLMEVLEDISSQMAASGSWKEAVKIARAPRVIARVQATLMSSNIAPNEASATELLTALLSCFSDEKLEH